ncbi:MAG TPA: hypothetical protein VH061_16245 [Solirubrobacteraceae bacterium]|jgi:hypothetical protein|nr:hypothetical protein [Solirubrobacteraceae bacterium]
MAAELERDVASGTLYIGRYLSEFGVERYPQLLRNAIEDGTDGSLAEALSGPELFAESYQKRKPSGGYTTSKVPVTAPTTLAEGEFNRFYLRGLCLRAIAAGRQTIEIYRARGSAAPRPESEAMIGRRLEAAPLLADLREHVGVDTALGLPPGPNSGLSGRLAD